MICDISLSLSLSLSLNNGLHVTNNERTKDSQSKTKYEKNRQQNVQNH